MNKLIAATAGLLLIGTIGATQASAQRVSVRIEKGNKSVRIDSNRSTRSSGESFRRGEAKHEHTDGHFEYRKKKVWVEGHYDIVTEEVWVPGKHVRVREARRDRCGNIYYVTVRKFVKGHYETCERKVWHAGHYKVVTEKVWVPGCGCDDAGNGHGHKKAKKHKKKGKKKGKKANRRRGNS